MSEVEAETYEESNNGSHTNDDFKVKEVNMSDSSDKEDSEPSTKKLKTGNDATVNDSKGVKDNDEEATPRGMKNNKTSKRGSAMSRIAKEGEALLKEMGHKDENPEGERRKTRSQTRGTPPVSARKNSRQETAKRSRRGRPRKEEKEKEEQENKAEKDEEEEKATKTEDVNNTEDKNETNAENANEVTAEEEESQPENETNEEKDD